MAVIVRCESESRSWRSVLDTTLCDEDGQWFSPGTLVSFDNKTERNAISEILLKVALSNKQLHPYAYSLYTCVINHHVMYMKQFNKEILNSYGDTGHKP